MRLRMALCIGAVCLTVGCGGGSDPEPSASLGTEAKSATSSSVARCAESKSKGCYWYVSTLAGTSERAFADGNGEEARFASPTGVAVARNGDAYVSDRYNGRIRRIESDGTASTVAGSGELSSRVIVGSALEVTIDRPDAIAVGPKGEVYFSARYPALVRKLDKKGRVTAVAGGGACCSLDGVGSSASFGYIPSIAADRFGNIYVADVSTNKIRRIDPEGVVSTLAGTGAEGADDGPTGNATFRSPYAVAVDDEGVVYVADQGNSVIRKIDNGVVSTIAGSARPVASGPAIDGDRGFAQFSVLLGIAVDFDGSVLVTDGRQVRTVSLDGSVATIAGTGEPGYLDGPGTSATFEDLHALAVDKRGRVILGSISGNSVRQVERIRVRNSSE